MKLLNAEEKKTNQTNSNVFTLQLTVHPARNVIQDLVISRKDANILFNQKMESAPNNATKILIVLPLMINSNSRRNVSKQCATKILEAAQLLKEKIVLNVVINVNFLLTAHKETLELFAAFLQERRNALITSAQAILTANVRKENGDIAEKDLVETNVTANQFANKTKTVTTTTHVLVMSA